ncbi:MAG: efflux RND transporter periplasmic adaptor subunit, partial [Gemmataceae bacterium]|nr:efflux RND transporter periplasmic adaptor subunit [Gemmataceae bacterium]
KLAIEMAQADAVRAEAGRDAAVAALQRARDPAGQIQPVGHVDAAEYQRRSAEAVLRMAQAKVRESQTAGQLAELALDQMILRAPVTGIVTEKRVTVGQMVGPAGPALFTVAPELEYVQLVALVAEVDIGRVRVGQSVNVTVNAWPDDTFLGRVARIGLAPFPTPGAVQFPVTIDLANVKDANSREWKLRTGMSASAEMVVRKHDNVWRLPAAAAGVTFDESRLSEPAKRKLARLAARTDRADWQRVWLMTPDRGPWPVIVRVGGRNSAGDSGIQDAQWIEVLAWDPEESAPAPGGTVPQVIVGVPESAKAAKPALKFF